MLIQSSKHTPRDLELWKTQEDADKIHSRRLDRLIPLAIHEIESFASHGKCYVSTSWGKDSVVLCHLVVSSIQIDVWNIRSNTRNPLTDLVRDAFLNRFQLQYTEINIDYGPLCSMSESQWKQHTDTRFFGAFREIGKAYGGRYINGVRGDESGVRMIRCRHYGLSTEKSCAPLGWWTTQDIFSYLAKYKLPIHPNYAMNGGGRWDRKYLRVADLGDIEGNQRGRAEWEQEYYRDELNRLAKQST